MFDFIGGADADRTRDLLNAICVRVLLTGIALERQYRAYLLSQWVSRSADRQRLLLTLPSFVASPHKSPHNLAHANRYPPVTF
jgi:hypothetical protein